MANDSSGASVIVLGGLGLLLISFVGYRYFQKRKEQVELEKKKLNPNFPGKLEGQTINQGERPFGVRDYTQPNPFGIKFNDPQSENSNIQNNRNRAIAMAYRFIIEISWLPVDPIGTRSNLDELSRVKQQNNACASIIYDNMQILIFNRGYLLADEEVEISITLAKAYLKLRGFEAHPGIPLSVC